MASTYRLIKTPKTMDISHMFDLKPVTLTEEQQITLSEIEWQLSLCSLDLSQRIRVEAKIKPNGEEGIAVKVFTDEDYASVFLPCSRYNDGFIHPSGIIYWATGDRTTMVAALRLAAQVLEGLDSLSDETLSQGPRSKWVQRQIELCDGCD
jgi:hypothetical protein